MNLLMILILILLLLLLSILVWIKRFPKGNYKEITPHQLRSMLCKEKDFVVLDVREAWEYRSGCIYKSLNLPVRKISVQMEEIGKLKEERIVVVCQSGFRSKMVCSFLEKEGFINLSHLKGGIKGWLKTGLKLVSAKDLEEDMISGT